MLRYDCRAEMGLVRAAKAAVVRKGVQQVFATRLRRARRETKSIIIASPWITHQGTPENALGEISAIITRYWIPTYIFSRPPRNLAEMDGLRTLAGCPSVELVHNENLHAKLYVCIAPYPYGFAILGSANMTGNSDDLYEIGLLVLAEGGGEYIVSELARFGLDYLRTRPESQIVKKMVLKR